MSLKRLCKQPDLGLSAEERGRCLLLWEHLENGLFETVCTVQRCISLNLDVAWESYDVLVEC